VNRVAPIVGLASLLGRGLQRIATDAIRGRVRSLPRAVHDLDTKSLGALRWKDLDTVALLEKSL
jgi:hypothetical protein